MDRAARLVLVRPRLRPVSAQWKPLDELSIVRTPGVIGACRVAAAGGFW
jgi:hypothetical protein